MEMSFWCVFLFVSKYVQCVFERVCQDMHDVCVLVVDWLAM